MEAYVKEKNLPDGDKRVTNDPMEATYLGITMWAQAVEQAGTTDVERVRMAGRRSEGEVAFRLRDRDGCQESPSAQAVFIAEVKGDGQFKVVWKTEGPIVAAPWSPYVPDSAKKVAD